MAEGGDGQDICTFFASFIDQRERVERLLNWLRESQTTCTDTNCFDSVSGLPGTEQGAALLPGTGHDHESQDDMDQNPFAIVLLFVFGMLTLYAMSMNRLNLERQPTKKAGGSGPQDDHNIYRRDGNSGEDGSPPSEI